MLDSSTTPVEAGHADRSAPLVRRNGALKVCLVGPPTVTDFEDPEVAESEAIRLIAEHAPIGVLSLAAVLEQHGELPHIVDLNRLYYAYLRAPGESSAKPDFCSYVAAELQTIEFDVLGFSSICSSYPLTIRIAREMKRLRPDVPSCSRTAGIGGDADDGGLSVRRLVVRGEAEQTPPALIEAIAAGATERHRRDHLS